MSNREIEEIQRIFRTRLEALAHILDVGATHRPDMDATMHERLAPDMYPLGTQVAFACNQPRGFSQWCAGQPVENLAREVDSLDQARAHISQTLERLADIRADDDKLDQVKRIGLGPGRFAELPARRYVSEYLMPNFYFHITTAYAILRMLGVPLGKIDFMTFIAPHVKLENAT